MRKINHFFIAMLAILSVSACTKEIDNPNNKEEVKLVPLNIEAGGESISDTKAIVSEDGTKIFWEISDKLGVFDGRLKREFTTSTADGTSSHTNFSGEVAEDAENLIAVYPMEAGVSFSGETVTAIIPKEQIVPTGKNIAQNAIVSVGKIVSGNLNLKTTVALVKVNIKRSDVKAIVIEGSNIAGTAEFSATDGSLSNVKAGENKVTLKHSEGVFAKGDYYVTLLPGTTSMGEFKVSLECKSCQSDVLSSKKEVTLSRNSSLDFSALESTISYKYVISTAEELIAWGKAANISKGNDSVELAADIDLDKADWTPCVFKGTFDGKGHKIYNFRVSTNDSYAGFFTSLSGELKNTVFGSADGNSYDGYSSYELGYTKDNKTWMYLGVVGKVLETSSISNVKNYAKIKVLASNITKFRLGGITGNWASTGSLSECQNHGEIVVEDCPQGMKGEEPEFNVIGGLVAWADSTPAKFENNDNYGKITNNCKSVKYFGGVLGSNGKQKFTISACNNYGDIDDNAEHEKDIWLGGILGKFNSEGQLENCKNHGKIRFTGKATYSNIAGILAYTNVSSTISNCENNGLIIAEPTDGGAMRVGGIVAMISSAPNCTVENSENKGEIKVNAQTTDKEVNIGGIVADISGKDANNSIIKNCTVSNTCKIEVQGGQEGINVGGICGKSRKFSKLEDSLVNEGKILIHDSQGVFQVGGIAGYAFHSADETFSAGSLSYNKGDIEATGLVNKEGKTHCIGGAFGYCTAEYRRIKVQTNISAQGKDGASISVGLAVGQSGKKDKKYKFHQGSFKGSISAEVEAGGNASNVHTGILYGSFKDYNTPDKRILQFGWDETLLFDPSITIKGVTISPENLETLSIGNPKGTPARFEANPGKPHTTHEIRVWNL